MGAFSVLFGSNAIVVVTLIGMFTVLLFRPERIIDNHHFRRAVLLLIVAIALPALIVLLSDQRTLGDSSGLLVKVLYAATTLCSAGSVFCLVNALSLGKQKQ